MSLSDHHGPADTISVSKLVENIFASSNSISLPTVEIVNGFSELAVLSLQIFLM
jgi:hypothetical protein